MKNKVIAVFIFVLTFGFGFLNVFAAERNVIFSAVDCCVSPIQFVKGTDAVSIMTITERKNSSEEIFISKNKRFIDSHPYCLPPLYILLLIVIARDLNRRQSQSPLLFYKLFIAGRSPPVYILK
jgi:hypothetical protein